MKKLTDLEIDTMLDYATTLIGLPFICGGQDPKRGVDCSGFVQVCLAKVGMDPKGDQTAQTLHHYFLENKYPIIKKKGSILFFGKHENKITHTALAIDTNLMIEAGGGGPECVNAMAARIKKAKVRIKPIDSRSDLISYFYLGV